MIAGRLFFRETPHSELSFAGLSRRACCVLLGVVFSTATVATPALASTATGSVYAWGSGANGQLGSESSTDAATPVLVPLPSGATATAVAAGYFGGYALGSDGTVYAWGDGSEGELGNGSTPTFSPPVAVRLPHGITATAIAAGGQTAYALGSDGNVYAWGVGVVGNLGNGSTGGFSLSPVEVALPSGVTARAIACGQDTAFAIGSNGDLYAWGLGTAGELGNGTFATSPIPVSVQLPSGVAPTHIAAAAFDGYAIGSDGGLYAWGSDYWGQLGDGSTSSSPTPGKVALPTGVTPMSIAGRSDTAYAIGSDGNVYAWGFGQDGELGNGSTASSSTPVRVDLPANITATGLGAGGSNSPTASSISDVVASNGRVYAWGGGGGALGNGTRAGSSVPVVVAFPSGVQGILAASGVSTGYAVGVSLSPATATPETSFELGLPLIAIGVCGGATILVRRRRRRQRMVRSHAP